MRAWKATPAYFRAVTNFGLHSTSDHIKAQTQVGRVPLSENLSFTFPVFLAYHPLNIRELDAFSFEISF